MKDSDSPKHDPLNTDQTCVVWHPSDRAPSRTLLRALGNKSMTIIGADDVHAAFAAAQRVSANTKRTIVVLDTREELHDVDRLLSALERFLPQALCWSHEPGANPPLVPLVQPKMPTPTLGVQATSHKPAPLRLVGQETQPEDPRSSEHHEQTTPSPSPKPAAPLSARDVLDADELDALLAGEIGGRKNERPSR